MKREKVTGYQGYHYIFTLYEMHKSPVFEFEFFLLRKVMVTW